VSVGGFFRAVANAPTPVHLLLTLLAVFAGIAGLLVSASISISEPWYDHGLIRGLWPEDRSTGFQTRDHSSRAKILFPAGMPRTATARMLKDNGFVCTTQEAAPAAERPALNCDRKLRGCGTTYVIRIFFDSADTVTDSSATSSTPICSS